MRIFIIFITEYIFSEQMLWLKLMENIDQMKTIFIPHYNAKRKNCIFNLSERPNGLFAEIFPNVGSVDFDPCQYEY